MRYVYPKLNAEMPSKEETKELMPNIMARSILDELDKGGIETCFHRHEEQQPQCMFGLRGLCCQRCLWGPCRLGDEGARRSRGICGATLEQIVMGNLLRSLAAGCAAHTQHALESIQLLRSASREERLPLTGVEALNETAERLEIKREGRPIRDVAADVGDILLQDLTRAEAGTLRALEAFAPRERIELWSRLGILPRGTYYEIVEALHRTTLGGCSDWRELAMQDLRTALVYCWSALFASSVATEIAFGSPRISEVSLGYSVLDNERVNILIHGHSPILAEYIVSTANTAAALEGAKEAGARGIQVAGMCCSGLELLARRGIPVAGNILGQELVVGTGLVDLLVADMQCVIPGIARVAECFGTPIVTTSDSNRIVGACHIPLRLDTLDRDAGRIVELAIASFKRRREGLRRRGAPAKAIGAEVGYDHRSILARLGGEKNMLQLLSEGRIQGIVTLVGCNNPKVPYERSQLLIARELLKADMLLTTTGCCAHALLTSGLCSRDAWRAAGESLSQVCQEYRIPPVLPVGACVDNVRTMRLFIELAASAEIPISEMPFMFSGPEPGNEKTLGQAVSFLLLGVSVHSGYPAGVPVPMPKRTPDSAQLDDYERGGNAVVDFFTDDAERLIGARLYVEPYPDLAAKLIEMHIRRKRMALSAKHGWC